MYAAAPRDSRAARRKAADAAYTPPPAVVKIDTGDAALDAELTEAFSRVTGFRPLGADGAWGVADLSMAVAAAGDAGASDTTGYLRGMRIVVKGTPAGSEPTVTTSVRKGTGR